MGGFHSLPFSLLLRNFFVTMSMATRVVGSVEVVLKVEVVGGISSENQRFHRELLTLISKVISREKY